MYQNYDKIIEMINCFSNGDANRAYQIALEIARKEIAVRIFVYFGHQQHEQLVNNYLKDNYSNIQNNEQLKLT